jgi:uncharacterized protein (TIGR00297 family)
VTDLGLAVILAAALAALGHRLRWLTTGGAVAAAGIGGAVFWGGGAGGALLLAVFFVSGSLLTAARDREPRTARQVLANGVWAATGALLVPLAALPGWLVLAGAIAAAQADTWATEIGVRATAPPRLVTTFSVVPPGTSGGVTLLGTAGGVLGAGVAAGLVNLIGTAPTVAPSVFAGGVLGMLVDSLAGATVQAKYRCPACGTVGERLRDACGVATVHTHGVWCVDNDVVNLLATFVGAWGALGWHFLT